jgi:hypothetical protein
MLALTSPTSGGRSVGIVRLRTKAMEFFYNLKMEAVFFFPECWHLSTIILKLPMSVKRLGSPRAQSTPGCSLHCVVLRGNPNSPWRTTTCHGENRNRMVFLPRLELVNARRTALNPVVCVTVHSMSWLARSNSYWLTHPRNMRSFSRSLPLPPASRRSSLWLHFSGEESFLRSSDR